MRSFFCGIITCLVILSVCGFPANAQVTIVTKRASPEQASSIVTMNPADQNGDTSAQCSATLGALPCVALPSLKRPSGASPQSLEAASIQTPLSETDKAVENAMLALFKTQPIGEGAGKEDPEPVQAINPFQLTDKLEWRIEGSDLDGHNEVGVFASQTLLQAGESSLKLDIGVNVEGKTGSTAGKAGLAMAW